MRSARNTDSVPGVVRIPLKRRSSNNHRALCLGYDYRRALSDHVQEPQDKNGAARRMATNSNNGNNDATATSSSSSSSSSKWQKLLVAATVPLSHCHSTTYTAEITIGTPPQHFTVEIDTADTDTWIPSIHCDSSCSSLLLTVGNGTTTTTTNVSTSNQWRKFYNPDASSTYQLPKSQQNGYYRQYDNGDELKGEHAMDVIRLSKEFLVTQQVFAQITSLRHGQPCLGAQGVLGLGLSPTTSHNFTSLMGNLQQQQWQDIPTGTDDDTTHLSLRYPIFSMYLDKTADDYVNTMPSSTSTTSSELLLGAVNQRHYEGCLTWHDVPALQMGQETASTVQFWALVVHHAQAKSTTTSLDVEVLQSTPSLAFVDCGAGVLVAPDSVMRQLATLNEWYCFDTADPNFPIEVACNATDGSVLDTVMAPCDNQRQRKYSLQLFFGPSAVADVTYELDFDDLFLRVDTDYGSACILQVATTIGTGWILGESFLQKYYAVYDFDMIQPRIGLAPARAIAEGDVCTQDWFMDVRYVPSSPNTGSSVIAVSNRHGRSGPSHAMTTFGTALALVIMAIVVIVLLTYRRRTGLSSLVDTTATRAFQRRHGGGRGRPVTAGSVQTRQDDSDDIEEQQQEEEGEEEEIAFSAAVPLSETTMIHREYHPDTFPVESEQSMLTSYGDPPGILMADTSMTYDDNYQQDDSNERNLSYFT